MNAMSRLFGAKKPPFRGTGVNPLEASSRQINAQRSADDVKKRLAWFQRATMTSELSDPKIKRRRLGAANV